MKNQIILINELKKGENSGFIENFNRNLFLKRLHEKYLSK